MNTLTFVDKSGRTRKAQKLLCSCGKQFLSRIDQPAKYCSKICAQSGSRKRIKVSCAYCGKAFEKNLYRANHCSKSKLHFCSRLCKDTAQRIGGIKSIQPSHYGTGKSDSDTYRLIYTRNGGVLKCSRCGYAEFECGIDIHHIDEDRSNSKKENLMALCSNCHRGLHNKLWKL
jgi:hypothetical protein